MEIKLSILIATMPSRKQSLSRLLFSLTTQNTSGLTVEIISNDRMDVNIGAKRNLMLQEAKGTYIVFIDDDDSVASNYVALILKAIESGPDCVGINGWISFDGGEHVPWFISKEYGGWYKKNGVYFRTPNHISPVKKDLALQAGFPELTFGEDAAYSQRLLPFLKSEIIIDQPLYLYEYVSKK